MQRYEFRHIRVLEENLTKAHVAPEITAQIMEGGEAITNQSSREARADWMREAMQRMDQLLDPEVRHAVREKCACCLGNKRHAVSKAIASDHATLEERIAAANETPFVFGHSVTRQDDGSIVVSFMPEGQEHYGCACLREVKEPLSITYCYCCGGHVKHHLQTALGRKLAVTVLSSSLSSGGTQPCRFQLVLADGDE